MDFTKTDRKMNTDNKITRLRKNSVYDINPPSIVASQSQIKSRRRRSLQAKRVSRDKDFFVPDDAEEWVLPEYRSLFHHLFLKDEEDPTISSSVSSAARRFSTSNATTASPNSPQRKFSPTDSTGSSPPNEDDGPLCNLVKSFPSWLKKVFNISENNNEQQEDENNGNRHAWLDEIPIEICDRLRHIHIYV